MPDKQSGVTPSPTSGTQSGSNAAQAGAASAGRYSLTVTHPDNKMTGGNLTISIEVEDNALRGLTASDDAGNTYEVSFSVKKTRAKNAGRLQDFLKGADSKETVAAPAGGGTTTDTAPSTEHGAGGGAAVVAPPADTELPIGELSDDTESDDECQCCFLVGGRLECRPCPCPSNT